MVQSYHTCNYLADHPFLLIGPIKQEILSLEPRVVIFHEFISVIGADYLKKYFKPSELNRSLVYNKNGNTLDHARISKQRWIHQGHDKIVDYLTNLVGILTGLNMNHSEAWQVLNYGIGGNVLLKIF